MTLACKLSANLDGRVGGAVLAMWLSLHSLAHADVPPPDSCTAPGQPCGEQSDCACAVSTCSRTLPCDLVGGQGGHGGQSGHASQSGDENDGGMSTAADGGKSGTASPGRQLCTVMYACNRCMTASHDSCPTTGVPSGTGGKSGSGAAASGGHAAGTSGGGASGSSTGDKSSGCSLTRLGASSSGGLIAAYCACLGLALRRRRSP